MRGFNVSRGGRQPSARHASGQAKQPHAPSRQPILSREAKLPLAP